MRTFNHIPVILSEDRLLHAYTNPANLHSEQPTKVIAYIMSYHVLLVIVQQWTFS